MFYEANHGKTRRVFSDGDEPIQKEPIYLSSDEDTASQYSMSDQELTKDDDVQNKTLNQSVVHPKDPTAAAQFKISNCKVDITNQSSSATTNSVTIKQAFTQRIYGNDKFLFLILTPPNCIPPKTNYACFTRITNVME